MGYQRRVHGRNKMFSPKTALLCLALTTFLSLRSDVSGKPKHLLIETEDFQKGSNSWETEAINQGDNTNSREMQLSSWKGKRKNGPGSKVSSQGRDYPCLGCPRKG